MLQALVHYLFLAMAFVGFLRTELLVLVALLVEVVARTEVLVRRRVKHLCVEGIIRVTVLGERVSVIFRVDTRASLLLGHLNNAVNLVEIIH